MDKNVEKTDEATLKQEQKEKEAAEKYLKEHNNETQYNENEIKKEMKNNIKKEAKRGLFRRIKYFIRGLFR